MKKKIFSILLILSIALNVSAQNKDAILGKWLNSTGEAQISTYKKGNQYFGKLVWLKNPNDEKGNPKIDAKNPDISLRKQSLLGLEILKNFIYDKDGIWESGTVYDPKSGKTYSCKINMPSNDKLNMRGYVGISLLGRTETWTRVK